ncbi:fumarylacetoacetate hydrolase family protein [Parvularcula lutaonensis]|uniref:fumarylacetoacetate hydrolase family protein n=1 Tax=Parvularcula lutaonensis TaxID=491923 RepID=UPI00167B5548|nr:fumarylacetoacetate hydrolase family protein [Parvularcula lutaonensis]GGY42692.1 fumarylacetoacetate (FAA) hydrolase [Parvularcula lutaonensis]
MKLASLKSGRDGKLVVVSKDLSRYAVAEDIAPTLQAALDDWSATKPRLEELSAMLERGDVASEKFEAEKFHSPLPRAYQWADGSAYINHVELVRKARGAEVPESFYSDPLMYQGGTDFLAPTEDIPLGDESWGLDLEGEIAVITGDVKRGVSPEEAEREIRLVMLVNDVSARGLIPGELAKGFGFFQSKPPTAFSPVAVTPDELGDAWDGRKLSGILKIDVNGEPFGRADAGKEMTFGFDQLVAHAARTRPLGAGTIIGSGTVSNKLDGGPGKPVSEGGAGYSCIAEIRMIETINDGEPKTSFLKDGDRVKIWMEDDEGRSIFGAIDQKVVKD